MSTSPAHPSPRSRPQRRLPSSPFRAEPPREVEVYVVGDRVAHDEHGLGTVTASDGHGVVVDFGNASTRIPYPFDRMEKL